MLRTDVQFSLSPCRHHPVSPAAIVIWQFDCPVIFTSYTCFNGKLYLYRRHHIRHHPVHHQSRPTCSPTEPCYCHTLYLLIYSQSQQHVTLYYVVRREQRGSWHYDRNGDRVSRLGGLQCCRHRKLADGLEPCHSIGHRMAVPRGNALAVSSGRDYVDGCLRRCAYDDTRARLSHVHMIRWLQGGVSRGYRNNTGTERCKTHQDRV